MSEVVISTPEDIWKVQEYMHFDYREGKTVCVWDDWRAQYILSMVANTFWKTFPVAHQLPDTVVQELSGLKQQADMTESWFSNTDMYVKVCEIMSQSRIAYRERQ